MSSVFIPPGRNPFQLPPRPQSHYVPSPSKEIQDKNVTLTPQKLNHRHEYSIPPEVYTPEQYSICEENLASAKPPLPVRDDDDVIKNVQKYLNDVESWNSLKYCEQWPSKENGLNEDSTFLKRAADSTMPGSSRPLTSTARSTRVKLSVPSATKDKPLRVKTSFASDRNLSQADSQRSSNIQMRLNRFRYGDPKPPEDRKMERVKPQTASLGRLSSARNSKPDSKSSSVSVRKCSTPLQSTYQKAGSSPPLFGNSIPKPPLPSDAESSPRTADTSISTLNTRLDKLLQASTLMTSSPDPQLSPRSSMEKSAASLRVSSIDSTESSELKLSGKFMTFEPTVQPETSELPRKMIWQKENLTGGLPLSPQKVRKVDDILYQWRLRRKLETARENVEHCKGSPIQHSHASHAPYARNLTERPIPTEPTRAPLCHLPVAPAPYHPCSCEGGPPSPGLEQLPSKQPHAYSAKPEMKSVGVGVSTMVSCETQTGESLIFCDEEAAPLPDAMGVKKPDSNPGVSREPGRPSSARSFPHTSTPASSVSFHRVKIVEAELEGSPRTMKGSPQAHNFSPVSGKTEATTVWSSAGNNKRSEDERSTVSSCAKTSDPRFASGSESCSPTANVVKQVIGSRLFNTSQTPTSSTSAVSRLKEKKKKSLSTDTQSSEQMNGSYTDSKRCTDEEESEIETEPEVQDSPSIVQTPTSQGSEGNEETSLSKPILENQSGIGQAFDPEEMFERLLQDIANDPNDYPNDVLAQLRSQKDQFLQEFQLIQEQIES